MTDGVTLAALDGLPPAAVIEELDFEASVARKVARFQDLWEARRLLDPSLPAIDTLHLPSDPGRKLMEEGAYDTMDLRARINDAARSNLLFYAQGSDIDQLVVFHDVVRLALEDDDQVKSRTVLAIAGRSPGGPKERYEAVARSTSARVRHVSAYRIGRDPTINMAVYSTDADGVADPDLLAAVRARLEAPGVALFNDVFNVRGAVRYVVDIALDVWLLPDAPLSILDEIPAALRRA
ncbi:baseplate J/gp47 family protein [Ancylobacter sp. G4_0304]|uniref:baseplate J/gp47 family protein n=1 Tax=Ancylobacter sp. G4_0304 TaxID=3114289 RepID=UPI0039C60020